MTTTRSRTCENPRTIHGMASVFSLTWMKPCLLARNRNQQRRDLFVCNKSADADRFPVQYVSRAIESASGSLFTARHFHSRRINRNEIYWFAIIGPTVSLAHSPCDQGQDIDHYAIEDLPNFSIPIFGISLSLSLSLSSFFFLFPFLHMMVTITSIKLKQSTHQSPLGQRANRNLPRFRLLIFLPALRDDDGGRYWPLYWRHYLSISLISLISLTTPRNPTECIHSFAAQFAFATSGEEKEKKKEAPRGKRLTALKSWLPHNLADAAAKIIIIIIITCINIKASRSITPALTDTTRGKELTWREFQSR